MIKIPIDPTNPGHVFAAVGLTELAYRLTGEATGYFDNFTYHLFIGSNWNITELITGIQSLKIRSDDPTNNDSPFCIGSLRLDWWLRSTAKDPKLGNLKTWSGTVTLPNSINATHNSLTKSSDLFFARTLAYLPEKTTPTALTSFDAQRGRSTLDTGYSPNELKHKIVPSPSVEFFALVGLQRAWPTKAKGSHAYYTWSTPLPPILLPAAIGGHLNPLTGYAFAIQKDGELSRLQPAQPFRQTNQPKT